MASPGGTARAAWTDLGQGIRVRQSRAFQMNSVALFHPEHTILIDPGVLPSELDDIAAETRAVQPKTVTLLFTHAHWDHVLGRSWWPAARTLAHDRFSADLERTMEWIHDEAEKIATKHGERWASKFEPFRPDERVSGLHFMKLGPWRLVLRDAFGHSESQLSIHLPEQRVLIAADMLSDIEVPMLESNPPAVYLETLRTLKPVEEGGAIETLIPGHGTLARGRAEVKRRFERDLEYLETLDREVRELRRSGASLDQARQKLATLSDVERHPDHPMRETHDENIRLAYEGAAAVRAGH
ncbi:MAG TPA: MBL fold metallo-hydrolase [Candidatus Udaeobacter sp.]|jgi:glyoxylase-like metal-dependent hydrolase (beta-lactamase superfamily II)|nr:MBL fold metallo-hydrolase [Candidatus Udaeobacter sp.]